MNNNDYPITLNDVLNIPDVDIPNVKIRFMKNWGEDPLDVYVRNPDEVNETHLLHVTEQRPFTSVGTIAIALIRMQTSVNDWLFTAARTITRIYDTPREDGVGYEAEDIERLKPFFGRVIVRYHKSTQAMCRRYETVKDELVVTNVLPDPFQGKPFPGFDKVCLSYGDLKNIIDNNQTDWINAFRSQKAVYLITDTSNGKLYVGSATAKSGAGMLLSRWKSYAEGRTGGNKRLEKLVDENGTDHIQAHFQFSILENYNERTSDDYIIERESWWKKVLDSRAHGYNAN